MSDAATLSPDEIHVLRAFDETVRYDVDTKEWIQRPWWTAVEIGREASRVDGLTVEDVTPAIRALVRHGYVETVLVYRVTDAGQRRVASEIAKR